MSKVLVDLPFEINEKEIDFWNMMNYFFTKYDDLEDKILSKYIDEWLESENINNEEFKNLLKSQIWN